MESGSGLGEQLRAAQATVVSVWQSVHSCLEQLVSVQTLCPWGVPQGPPRAYRAVHRAPD